MTKLYFDIETGPLPPEELSLMVEPFDPENVKFGNLKDVEKRRLKVEEDRVEFEQKQIEQAALDPLTGRVLAIGIMCDGRFEALKHDEEADLLWGFWDMCFPTKEHIGFNIYQFDLPFLIRRSWKHGIKVPGYLRQGRYWNRDRFIDLRDEWTFGDKQAKYTKGSLDTISRHLGMTPKEGSGKDFHIWWNSDRDKAIAYLKEDLLRTQHIDQVIRP